MRAALSGSLSLALVATLTPPVRADDERDGWCEPRLFIKRHRLSPRNFFIPRTRYIDGPGGEMTVSVTREHEVLAFLETEKDRRKEFRDERGAENTTERGAENTTERGAENTTERGAETTIERGAETTTERGTETTTTQATEIPTDGGTETTTRSDTASTNRSDTASTNRSDTASTNRSDTASTTESETKTSTEGETEITAEEVIRAFRREGIVHLEERHKVFSGHDYTREISEGMYGNMWYRVFGYRIGWSAWSVLRTCRHVKVTSGIANVPAKVEGWRYWETKHPMYKGRMLSVK
ncbi:hypothetical protein [Nonomuraea basaltis]|uniref:hypothetical protein n=1 Tax=Nonomuraea basaltis TaxID=2495887 RepID=UPI00110C6914|nr:hypothetical protein [Nonomuraea basaltis]TMR99838.1 hypothetical protein EJK15_04795 [Nonomuraea basaltis]